MIDKLQRFFAISVPGFPTGVLVGFAGVFVIGTIGFLAFLGPRRGASLLLGCAFGRMKWWKALAIGGGFSLLIEVLQFAFKRGFVEFDDVFHNVLGCAIGFGVYLGITYLIQRLLTKP